MHGQLNIPLLHRTMSVLNFPVLHGSPEQVCPQNLAFAKVLSINDSKHKLICQELFSPFTSLVLLGMVDQTIQSSFELTLALTLITRLRDMAMVMVMVKIKIKLGVVFLN